MDKDISIWDAVLRVVSIGETDDRNGVCEWCRWNGVMPGVKQTCEEYAGLGPEPLPWSGSLSVQEFVEAGHGELRAGLTAWH